jgi:hypothetical protein
MSDLDNLRPEVRDAVAAIDKGNGVFVNGDGCEGGIAWATIRAELLRLARAEAELAALKARMQWQPIETAPRDGSSVIIGCAGKGSGEGVYATEPGWKGWPEPGWYWVGEDADLARPIEPTHWMPLPPPPKGEE